MQRGRANTPLFWSVLGTVVIADVITKAIAVYSLVPQRIPHELFGDTVRFTLVYNPGAAFGLNLGPQSRWIFAGLTLVALVILGRLYRTTRAGHVARSVALALVCAGAVGNLLDRMRSFFGVVDFIDVGIGDTRWPTFSSSSTLACALLEFAALTNQKAATCTSASSATNKTVIRVWRRWMRINFRVA